MRKFTIFALVLVLAFALTACGRRNDTPTEAVPPATQAPTQQSTMPTIDPTMGTNIPDPEVDSTMPDLMDPTGGSDPETGGNGSGGQDSSGNTSGQAGQGN
ncbi:MAG: hypothetical protein IJO45_02055 [Oscillospiraceae bacterium]|nr:hypothetical protein [Oscillospiraceae bacterium]